MTLSLLSEQPILFGKEIKIVEDGIFDAPVRVALPVGSVLVLNGNGADVAKHCVPAVSGERVLREDGDDGGGTRRRRPAQRCGCALRWRFASACAARVSREADRLRSETRSKAADGSAASSGGGGRRRIELN